MLVEQVGSVELVIQTDDIIIISPDVETARHVTTAPVDGSLHLSGFVTQGGSAELAQTSNPPVIPSAVSIEQDGPDVETAHEGATAPVSEPPQLDGFATQGGSAELAAQTSDPLVTFPGVSTEPIVATEQDESPHLSGLATQGGSAEPAAQTSNPPVASPGMSTEPDVETEQDGSAVEAEPVDEPNLGEHVVQVEPTELFARASVLLDGLGDVRRRECNPWWARTFHSLPRC